MTVLSVYVSTVAISKIDQSKRSLTNESIPALIDVGHLSSAAINIIKQSLLMSSSVSIKNLDEKMETTNLSINNLLDNLKNVESYGLAYELIEDIRNTLTLLNGNIDELYYLKSNILTYRKQLNKEIDLMRAAIETIEDKASLMKINADHKFLQEINNLDSFDQELVKELLKNEINTIELVSSVIMRSGELRKDLNAINDANNDESILFIQQEFNHSIRKIVRTIVQSRNVEFHHDIKKNIAVLIEYGQDSPDIFDSKQTITTMSERLKMISEENIIYTEKFNAAVSLLARQVKDNAELSSSKLDESIYASRKILYVILFIALVISFIISWVFIYKKIIVRIAELSSITKKLSSNNFQFDINTQGDDEFSEFAIALESLREHSLKRIYLNKALEKNSLRLKQSNEDLSQFAYIASHDLQEPLRMVGSYVQLIKSKYKGKLDSDSDTYIDYAVDGCIRMKALIEGLLEYSRVESSSEELQSIDCNALLEDVIHDLSIQIHECNAEIIVSDMPSIYAIPSQLRMVFSNLIGNALKYCENDIPRVEIQSTINGDKIKFSVKDNGIGIKPRYQEKIFVIFKRLHSRAEYSGTGIGLSICKKIIERHGGNISLKSELGEGAIFYFTLPISPSMTDVDDYKIAI